MDIKEINDLLSLLACVSCSEIDGSMCEEYSHQVNESLKDYPEEIKVHFIELWITISRCVEVNK